MNNTIYNISQIFAEKGVSRVVLSPGSRNAPLTISFSRNPSIETYNIVDERSAGFIALGMSLKSRAPIAICCTSGSAMLNYAPAVSEAYYQNIPLIIISADRPPEWIDQRDGQTINQVNALANFVKGSFSLPVDLDDESDTQNFDNQVNQAINLACAPPFGPVHINIPFREPFYPETEKEYQFEDASIIKATPQKNHTDYDDLIKRWNSFNKKLILIGQNESNSNLTDALKTIKNPLIVDVISNVKLDNCINTHDLFLANINSNQSNSLSPELLVTTGKSLISKNLKIFLRKNKPIEHWHFEDTDKLADTFRSITHHYKTPLCDFLATISNDDNKNDFSFQIEKNYLQNWNMLEEKTCKTLSRSIQNQEFSEVKAYYHVYSSLPKNTDVHLANSMTVRYANFFQFSNKLDIEVYANRGTSGIDGSNGAAVGNAIIGERNVILLTGDLSFFYDRNSFFHQYNISKLKIIVFNNQGGGIFRLIKGPSELPELKQHFETRHYHNASFTAAEYGFDYYKSVDEDSLSNGLTELFKDSKTPQLLEVFTEPETNSRCYTLIQKAIYNTLQTN